MESINKNEFKVLLTIFKGLDKHYNAHNLSEKIGLSHVGTLKILKRLEKQGILISEKLGNAIFYKIKYSDPYVETLMTLALNNEARDAKPNVKRWISELKKLDDYSNIKILFGSVLHKNKFNDVDVLLVSTPKQFKKIKKELDTLNKINLKRIHIIKQTKTDLQNNLKNRNKVVLDALETGIVISGQNKFFEVMKDVAQ